jgi:hypothetical protein
MSLPSTGGDRNFKSFHDCDGNVARRVYICQADGSTVEVTGAFSLSGLNTAIETTVLEIGDTASPIPGTSLTSRNAMSFVNLSETDTLYIGDSDVEANRTVGGKGGWEVLPGETFNIDITDGITLYGISESGKTILVKVLEVA